jgi:microcystin-dependent protein
MSRARTIADYAARNADNKAGLIAFFSASTAPDGWLACDGAVVSRTTYAALFAAIGTTYGVGDGTTTFSLPDLRGEFLRGLDGGRGVDSGRTIGSAQGGQMPQHNHDVFRNSSGGGAVQSFVFTTASAVNTGTAVATTVIPTGNAGGANNSAENRPRNVAMLPCIKT